MWGLPSLRHLLITTLGMPKFLPTKVTFLYSQHCNRPSSDILKFPAGWTIICDGSTAGSASIVNNSSTMSSLISSLSSFNYKDISDRVPSHLPSQLLLSSSGSVWMTQLILCLLNFFTYVSQRTPSFHCNCMVSRAPLRPVIMIN